jgi:predicted ester cyclase
VSAADDNKALVRQITDRIWNARELDRIPDFYASDFVADSRPYAPPCEGHAGIRGMVERAWAAFPDYHDELHELVAEGDRVVARFTISGTQCGPWGPLAPTGRRVEFEEVVILGIRGAKVAHQRGVADNLTALRQLQFSAEKIAALDRAIDAEPREMDLRELRETAGKTQEELAAALKKTQPEVSRLERRGDYRLSTLQRFVTALGGELKVVASFGNRRVRLRA